MRGGRGLSAQAKLFLVRLCIEKRALMGRPVFWLEIEQEMSARHGIRHATLRKVMQRLVSERSAGHEHAPELTDALDTWIKISWEHNQRRETNARLEREREFAQAMRDVRGSVLTPSQRRAMRASEVDTHREEAAELTSMRDRDAALQAMLDEDAALQSIRDRNAALHTSQSVDRAAMRIRSQRRIDWTSRRAPYRRTASTVGHSGDTESSSPELYPDRSYNQLAVLAPLPNDTVTAIEAPMERAAPPAITAGLESKLAAVRDEMVEVKALLLALLQQRQLEAVPAATTALLPGG